MDPDMDSVQSGNTDLFIPVSRRMKIITTLSIFYGNVAYGCATNAFSPALTDFKTKFGTDTSTISVVFVVALASYMVGALLCTVIYNIINRQFAVILLFLGITATMVAAPHVTNLGQFFTLGSFLGFFSGCYDAAQFVWIMEMWQQDSGPYVQAQHFCFAAGTVLSPLIMAPFLSKEEGTDNVTVTTTTTTSEGLPEQSNVFIPFTVLGILCIISAIAQGLLFIFLRYKPPKSREISAFCFVISVISKFL